MSKDEFVKDVLKDLLCPICEVEHTKQMPHDATSKVYRINFVVENNRNPTWEDAMSHCDEELKQLWREELAKLGIDSKSENVRGIH